MHLSNSISFSTCAHGCTTFPSLFCILGGIVYLKRNHDQLPPQDVNVVGSVSSHRSGCSILQALVLSCHRLELRDTEGLYAPQKMGAPPTTELGLLMTV